MINIIRVTYTAFTKRNSPVNSVLYNGDNGGANRFGVQSFDANESPPCNTFVSTLLSELALVVRLTALGEAPEGHQAISELDVVSCCDGDMGVHEHYGPATGGPP